MSVISFFNKCGRFKAEITLLAVERGTTTPNDDQGTRGLKADSPAERHLADCPKCRARYDELLSVVQPLHSLRNLPQVSPTAALSRRWMAQVRTEPHSSFASVWLEWVHARLTWNRAGWGALSAIWMLVLFFRLSAPEASAASEVASQTSSREIILVLQSELQPGSARVKALLRVERRAPSAAHPQPRTQHQSTTTDLISV